MPLALAGLQIHRDHALAEQSVARAMAAVVIAGRQFDRQIDQAQIFIHANLPPDAGVAGVGSAESFSQVS